MLTMATRGVAGSVRRRPGAMISARLAHSFSRTVLHDKSCRTLLPLARPCFGRPLVRMCSSATSEAPSREKETAAMKEKEGCAVAPFEHSWQLWLSNVCATRSFKWDPRYWVPRHETPLHVIRRALRTDEALRNDEMSVVKHEIRPRDGGVLLEMNTAAPPSEFLSALQGHLAREQIRVPLAVFPVAAHQVLGHPFTDDVECVASRRLTIDVFGSDRNNLSLRERVFELLRPYGAISSITASALVKDLSPRVVDVQFDRTYAAATARTCLHRYEVLPDTTMHVSYNDAPVQNKLVAWVQRNPRLMVLLTTLALGMLTFFIFDPIRVLVCSTKVSGRFQIDSYDNIRWLSGLLGRGTDNDGLGLAERTQDEKRLQTWLNQPPGSILYITGAKGTGKSSFVQCSRQHQKTNVLFLDVEQMVQRADDDFVTQLAQAVGFWPAFGFLSWMGALMDAFTPGTGRAAVTSTTTKVMNILDVLTRALSKHHDPCPLVIIDGFSVENRDSHEGFMKHLLKWAAMITETQKARVVFIADSAFDAEGGISDYIPGALVDELVLGDASLESAVKAVEGQLGQKLSEDMVDAVATVGGRFAHLQLLVRKVKGGVDPITAKEEMIEEAVVKVRDALFSSTFSGAALKAKATDLWPLVVEMAERSSLAYDDVLFTYFKGNADTMRALVRCGLFTAVPGDKGKLQLAAGSPLLQAAFERITADVLVSSGLDINLIDTLVAKEEGKIASAEQELIQLQKTGENWREAARQERQRHLLDNIAASQKKILGLLDKRSKCAAALKKARLEG